MYKKVHGESCFEITDKRFKTYCKQNWKKTQKNLESKKNSR